jgi:branched-chain amino acid transport system substrate-binding protein
MARLLKLALVAGVLAAALACGEPTTVQIGAVLPLTGSSAVYGEPIRNGIQLAFDEAVEAGYPFPVELEILDSRSDPEAAAEATEMLFSNEALAVIGGVTSDEALKVVEVADRYDHIVISPSASSPELTGISKNFFRVFPSDFLDGTAMGNFSTQKLAQQSVVIIAAESLYGRGSQQVFKDEFERYGGVVLEVIEYPKGTADFSGLVGRAVSLNPDAVYLADFAGEISAAVKELRKHNFEGRILTTHAFAAPEVLAEAGEAAEGVYLTQPRFEANSEEPHVQHFVKDYKAAYGHAPDLYAAHGYDAMLVVLESLRGAKRPSTNEFRKGLRGLRDFPGVTGNIQFDEKGDVQKYPRVYIVSEGELFDYESYVEARREELRQRMRELDRQRRAAGN